MNLPSVERDTHRALVADSEGVVTLPAVLEEVAIMEGVLQPMRGIVTIPLMVKPTLLPLLLLPNLRSHKTLMGWITDTRTACSTRTLEIAVILQYLSLMVLRATQAHRSSLQCKAPNMNNFHPLEGLSHSLRLYNQLLATLSSLTMQRTPT